MTALTKIGSALMGIGGILIGILGILVWADATVMAWYQGLSYLVLGVGLLLWSIPAVFSAAASGARPAEAGAQRSRA